MKSNKIYNAQEALNYLKANPKAKLYDEYVNFIVLSANKNHIEYHYYEIEYDEDGNDISFWNYNIHSFEDFLDCFENKKFELVSYDSTNTN